MLLIYYGMCTVFMLNESDSKSSLTISQLLNNINLRER